MDEIQISGCPDQRHIGKGMLNRITLGNLSGLVEMRGLEVGYGMYRGESGNK